MPRNPLYVAWGENLRTARLAAGLSQRKLAAGTSATHYQISNIERGVTSISDSLRMELARELDRPVHELFPYPQHEPAEVA